LTVLKIRKFEFFNEDGCGVRFAAESQLLQARARTNCKRAEDYSLTMVKLFIPKSVYKSLEF
jgi:hypothetical protein